MAHYLTAQLCLNGHLISDGVDLSPQLGAKYCLRCGAKTITQCSQCHANIRGDYYVEGVIGFSSSFTTPAFCHNCGTPYPWTESALAAARALAEEMDDLSSQEKEKLQGSLEALVRDTPDTPVAVTRFKRIMAKLGGGAAEAFRSILVDVASETAKKMLWP